MSDAGKAKPGELPPLPSHRPPLAKHPSYNGDLNTRVEWENDRTTARPVKTTTGPAYGNNKPVKKK
jgi:hypothetical protein